MTQFGLPVLYAVVLWWAGTIAVLYLNGLPRRTGGCSLSIASALAMLALGVIAGTAGEVGSQPAYLAFTAALVLWGWHELAYYTGFVTGPEKSPCPAEAGDLERFRRGVNASLYHELAIVLTAALLAAITWGQPNQTATLTFTVLWLMRWSTKLNIFLGVRNLHQEFWPDHLQYLVTFTRYRRMNLLFPVSVTASVALTTLVVRHALSPAAAPEAVAGLMLVATIMGLAVLEHWLLMLPLPDDVLWRWGMRSRDACPPSPPIEEEPGKKPVARRLEAMGAGVERPAPPTAGPA